MNAPPLKCLEIILNTAEYPFWNTSFRRVTTSDTQAQEIVDAPELQRFTGLPGYLYAGVKMSAEVYMTPGARSPVLAALEVTVLEKVVRHRRTGYRIAWKAVGRSQFLLHMERVQEFIETEAIDGQVRTEYFCWETFGGVLSYPMRYLMGQQLEGQFSRWMKELKAVAEKAR
ncbi:uncharacterized protein FRV6_16745 [Fusarium oxysporum]|uniref:Coenzyme Q-binding protein COQ10 START domain-containing protein n=1 Tax=Fusarium oxysporum TaxID=5507 RepID=A0A2H3TVI4_FUSOX|nr:uncharacterized protein FRV6_16745 [Fusarium oxysporum]